MASVSQEAGAVGRKRQTRSTSAILLNFLGSMNLAITLLVAICIASVIGTVVQQNQPYEDYLSKFGPFWFPIFDNLGLYDVYSAMWYLAMLAFLVVSVSVCLARQTPGMLREMGKFREHQQERSLRAFSNHREWRTTLSPDEVETVAARALKHNGMRMRRKDRGDAVLLAGMAGSSNRIGYILTHLAIVVICVGGLVDGNLMLKYREWTGDLTLETRNIPVSQIGDESRIPPGRGSFRGMVNIPEGAAARVVFLPLRDGYIVQELPFRIEVEEFRVEHWDTGEPSLFESDLIITGSGIDEPIHHTLRVNHPLIIDGYAIYQSSFGDGGSTLNLRGWSLLGDGAEPLNIEQKVSSREQIEFADGSLTLELTEFETFNTRRVPGTESREMEELGPSFEYRLRGTDGSAREFHNYMRPVDIDGRKFFLSGMRTTPQEPFRYLHLPADRNDRPDTFLFFHDALSSEQRLRDASERGARVAMREFGLDQEELVPQVAATGRELARQLLDEGLGSVMTELESRMAGQGEEETRQSLVMFSRLVLERTLWEAFTDARTAAGDDPERELGESDQVFFQDALSTIPALAEYGVPLFLELDSYNHRQATGLQIARAPGANIVYFGSALLVAGILLLFYVSHRRVWCWIRSDGGRTMLLVAGANQRDPLSFERKFGVLGEEFDKRLKAAESTTGRHGSGDA